jgi:hypothetical protein
MLLGCADVSKWSTTPGQSYCGVVTGAKFVRVGIDEGTKLRLELDAEHLQTSPGKLWSDSFLLDPVTKKPIGERFDGLELRVIPELLSDPLSTLSFGEGRVKSAILVGDLRSADGKSTSEVMVFLSLMQSGDVEIRIVRGAAGSAPAPPRLFGVFSMQKADGNCGID